MSSSKLCNMSENNVKTLLMTCTYHITCVPFIKNASGKFMWTADSTQQADEKTVLVVVI